MKKTARLLLVLSMLIVFSLLIFTAYAQEAPTDFTLYVKNGINGWTGSAFPGEIQGNAIVESGVIPNPGYSNRVYDGNIYYMQGAAFNPNNSMSDYNRNAIVPVTTEPFIFSSLVFADVPVLPPRGSLTTNNYQDYNKITEDGYYDTIEVANNGTKGIEIVAPEGTVRKIRVKKLILNGKIVISGSGKVLLYVEEFVTLGINNPSINAQGDTYDDANFGNPSQCAVYFYGTGNISLTNIRAAANIYSKNSHINLDASHVKIFGNIYAVGNLTLGSSCDIYGYVYAPGSDVILSGNSVIYGKLLANTVTFEGSGKIRLGDIYPIDREIVPEGDGLPDEGSSDPFKGKKPGILGSYYDSYELFNETAIRMMRIDDDIAWNWKLGSPDPVIEPETYSVKWTGYITVPKTGNYLFRTYSDDGVRLTINGSKLIDRWGHINLEFTTANESVYLEENKLYPITLEYHQIPFNSTIFLFWESEDLPMQLVPSSFYYVDEDIHNAYATPQYMNELERQGNGLQAKFYNGAEGLNSGQAPDYTEINLVNYEFMDGTPGGVTTIGDDFSTVITGKLEGKFTEEMTLEFITDDGIRVWFDGKLILDKWEMNNRETYTAKVNTIVGHKHSIRIEHNDLGGGATLIMRWYSPSQELEIIPLRYLYSE